MNPQDGRTRTQPTPKARAVPLPPEQALVDAVPSTTARTGYSHSTAAERSRTLSKDEGLVFIMSAA